MSTRRTQPPAMIAGPTGHEDAASVAPSDPRAVRVGVAAATRLDGDPAFSVAPPPDPAQRLVPVPGDVPQDPLVDGVPTPARLRRLDHVRAVLETTVGGAPTRTVVLFGPVRPDRQHGTDVREVVVDGWRIEVEIEPERRAVLRERARRGAGAAAQGGPVEVRAIIPGRVVAIAVGPGDAVEAGQQILVVEAMKMQNELRAPREGAVERVGVAVGDTIEVGDLLVVIR
jgi:3-methylcrotonyl-CoA carboxylase alpha subunit